MHVYFYNAIPLLPSCKAVDCKEQVNQMTDFFFGGGGQHDRNGICIISFLMHFYIQ